MGNVDVAVMFNMGTFFLLTKPLLLLNDTFLLELRISHLKKNLRILEHLKQIFREVVACISELRELGKERQ